MTVIACDGVRIACDSRRTGRYLDMWDTRPKIHVPRRGEIIAVSGACIWTTAFAAWAAGKKGQPVPQISEDAGSGAAAHYARGRWQLYFSNSPHPEPLTDTWAIGSGQKFAAAALALGHDAETAVCVAIMLEETCGGPTYSGDVAALASGKSNVAEYVKALDQKPRSPAEVPARLPQTRRTHGLSRVN